MARGTKINSGKGSVGDIISSMLDLAQFQAENGTDWELADGATAAGTKYNTITGESNKPDLRGVVLRGKDHGTGKNPDGDTALGTYQDHEFDAHGHSVINVSGSFNNVSGFTGGQSNSHKHAVYPHDGGGPAGLRAFPPQNNGVVAPNYGYSPGISEDADTDHAHSLSGGTGSFTGGTGSAQGSGGLETRMRNVTVNHFIKVN